MQAAARAFWSRPGARGLVVALAIGVALAWQAISRPPVQAQNQAPAGNFDLAACDAQIAALGDAITREVATNFINGVRLFVEGKGTGQTPLVNATDVVVFDVNGDGCTDAAFLDRDQPAGQLQVLMGDGEGTFAFWRDFTLDGQILSITKFAADGDPFDGLAIGLTGDENRVCLYSGGFLTGGADGPTCAATEHEPRFLAGSTGHDPASGALFNLVAAGLVGNNTDVTGITGLHTSAPLITADIQIDTTSVLNVISTPLSAVAIRGEDLFLGTPDGVFALDITDLASWTSSNPATGSLSAVRGVVQVNSTPSPTRIGVGDFNHDGRTDLVTTSAGAPGQTLITATTGSANGFVESSINVVDSVLEDIQVIVGDANRDGFDDVLVGQGGGGGEAFVLPGAENFDGELGSFPLGLNVPFLALGSFSGACECDITNLASWASSPAAIVSGAALDAHIANQLSGQIADAAGLGDQDWYHFTVDDPSVVLNTWDFEENTWEPCTDCSGNAGNALTDCLGSNCDSLPVGNYTVIPDSVANCVGSGCGSSFDDTFGSCPYDSPGCTPPSECLGDSCLELSSYCSEDNNFCSESNVVVPTVQIFFSGGYTAAPPSANSTVVSDQPGGNAHLDVPPDPLRRLGRSLADWLLPARLLAQNSPTVSIVANGASLGQSLEVQVTDPSGQVKTIAMPQGVALQPVEGRPKPFGADARLPRNTIRQDVGAYCMDFAKEPPPPGQAFRIAPADVQQQVAPYRRVLQAANRVADQLHPDSEPTAYLNAIRQYALWSKIENWDEAAFGENFLERTKKNAENAGVSWSSAMEGVIKRVIPGRWRDIQLVLDEAGR